MFRIANLERNIDTPHNKTKKNQKRLKKRPKNDPNWKHMTVRYLDPR